MTRWIIWCLLLVLTSGTSTLASRARNTPSYAYHSLAAWGSHGSYFLAQLAGLDLLIEMIRSGDRLMMVLGFFAYSSSSTLGSVLSHWVAMTFFEKGNRRVGAYGEKP